MPTIDIPTEMLEATLDLYKEYYNNKYTCDKEETNVENELLEDKRRWDAYNFLLFHYNEVNKIADTAHDKLDGCNCPKCGAVEVGAMTPRTVYDCGSSDYDQRPNTFHQSDTCKKRSEK